MSTPPLREITLSHKTATGHRIVGHKGKCARLHGHTYQFDVTIRTSFLTDPGFILDYGLIKEELDKWDHQLLLWSEDPLGMEDRSGQGIRDSGVVRVPFNPTAEKMAEHLTYKFLAKLERPGEYQFVKVTVHESPLTSATYFDETREPAPREWK